MLRKRVMKMAYMQWTNKIQWFVVCRVCIILISNMLVLDVHCLLHRISKCITYSRFAGFDLARFKKQRKIFVSLNYNRNISNENSLFHWKTRKKENQCMCVCIRFEWIALESAIEINHWWWRAFKHAIFNSW